MTSAASSQPHVVVATIVHHPEDARIRHRQIVSLLDAGFKVTYIAPDGDMTPDDRITRVVVPRAVGRNRLRSLRAARHALAVHTEKAHITIIHDPELVVAWRSIATPRVWDVHEDTVSQIVDKSYIPQGFAWAARLAATGLERLGKAKFERLIAETSYRDRHPDALLVRNTPRPAAAPPSSESGRAVYLGRVSMGRGLETMNAIADLIAPDVALEIIGPVDSGLAISPNATSLGLVPNTLALEKVSGATVGLSLLRDLPNYLHSMPTKLLEFLGHGIPVISTPLPEAVAVVEGFDCGVIVPFDDPTATAEAILALNRDHERRHQLAANGHAAVMEHFNWADDEARFISHLRRLARG